MSVGERSTDRIEPSRYADRIERLAERANRTAREPIDVPFDAPDPERAVSILQRELGPVVSVYIEARTDEDPVAFSGRELDRLHEATNVWLRLYAACYGVSIDPDVTIRDVAELVIETHDIKDTAALLTGVPIE
ncbi:MAG: hypothetical protein ACQETB_10285 [Halobacteriota archaeon]